MIKPVNGHLLIEPLPYEQFIATDRETYQEIGVVVDFDETINGGLSISGTSSVSSGIALNIFQRVNKGDKVYFDSWLAAKFPKDNESYYWLVKWEDVRAVEYAKPEIPEQPVQE